MDINKKYKNLIRIENILSVIYILLMLVFVFAIMQYGKGANDLFTKSVGLMQTDVDPDFAGFYAIAGLGGVFFSVFAYLGILALVVAVGGMDLLSAINFVVQALLVRKRGVGGVIYIIFNILFMITSVLPLIILIELTIAKGISLFVIVTSLIWLVLFIIKIYSLILRRKVDLTLI